VTEMIKIARESGSEASKLLKEHEVNREYLL